MKLETELWLSAYRVLGDVGRGHRAKLIQHVETGQIFVGKILSVYDVWVYERLMNHPQPGVPRVEDFREDEGKLYVVEEYRSGVTLRQKLEEEGPVGEARAADWVRQLCVILAPFHQMDPPIVHRDIKPENILVNEENQLVLLDFNAAKAVLNGKARDTVLIGTAGYAAPEQYGFSASRPMADIYALGVLLHELLTGGLPGETAYNGPLSQVIRTCLAMDPADRYPGVEALGAALGGKKRRPKKKKISGARSWLPPGMRQGRPWAVILSGLWYAMVIWSSVTMELPEVGRTELIINRVFCCLFFMGLTFWLGNYRGIWDRLPLARSPELGKRVLGVVLWAVVLTFLLLAVMAVLISVLV